MLAYVTGQWLGMPQNAETGFPVAAFSTLPSLLRENIFRFSFEFQSSPREESNCTTVHTHIADWLDFAFTCEGNCQDQGRYPCLQVFVNLSHSGQKELLHYDDEAIRTNTKVMSL